jgi:hypothetical protein
MALRTPEIPGNTTNGVHWNVDPCACLATLSGAWYRGSMAMNAINKNIVDSDETPIAIDPRTGIAVETPGATRGTREGRDKGVSDKQGTIAP